MNKPAGGLTRPRPQPPEKPLPTDCCDSGCVDCIFDQYSDALRAYERALAAWELEQAGQAPEQPGVRSD